MGQTQYTILKKYAIVSILFLLCSYGKCVGADPRILEADRLYMASTLQSYDKAISLYKAVLAETPGNFESAWKCARACQWAGDLSQFRQVKGWKKKCTDYGEAGMAFAEKAIQIEPDHAAGYYFRGCCAGTLATGASIYTILKMNLLGIIQESFETAYRIDKTFDQGGVMQALSRFYFLAPWPRKDVEKALIHLRENQRLFPNDPCGQTFLAEALLASGNPNDRKEAKALLKKAICHDSSQYTSALVEIYSGLARRLLEKI